MDTKLPKYIQLVNWIKDQIINNNLVEGDKFYSENELSEMFKISRQTVRQSISLLEVEGFLERRRGSGTYVSYSERKTKITKNIGIISTYIDSYIFPSIIKGIERTLSKNGYSMQLSFTYNKIENERKSLLSMIENDVDGLIVEPTKSVLPNPNIPLYKEIINKKIPLLFFHAYYPEIDEVHHVCMDDILAGKMATEHLLNAGHRRIAGFFQLDDLQGHKRYEGYLQALKNKNIEVDANKVLWFSTEDINYFEDDASRVMRYLKDCTGLVCYNDQIAFKVINILKKRDIFVPNKISIVGIDNSNISTLSEPSITSVTHPMDKLGKRAAENMLELIKNPDFNATYEFKPTIVARNSVRII